MRPQENETPDAGQNPGATKIPIPLQAGDKNPWLWAYWRQSISHPSVCTRVYDVTDRVRTYKRCFSALMGKNTPRKQRHTPIAGSMLVQRLRRWPNIDTVLGGCLMFAANFNEGAIL